MKRSTLADTNERGDWLMYADFVQVLIRQFNDLCRPDEKMALELDNVVYAMDATTKELCLDLFWWTRPAIFYDKYNNNERFHSATVLLPPRLFWKASENDLVVMRKNIRKRNIFQLKVPGYLLSGNLSPEGVSHFAGLRFDKEVRQPQPPLEGQLMVSGVVT